MLDIYFSLAFTTVSEEAGVRYVCRFLEHRPSDNTDMRYCSSDTAQHFHRSKANQSILVYVIR